MSKLLTMIIPVYNTEKYLERCISSCISEEVQIIAIDDGSTDNSLETLKRLKATYQDIEILNGNHQGAVHARRMGLAKVNTKYFSFVDSDDKVRIKYLIGNNGKISEEELKQMVKNYIINLDKKRKLV